MKEVEADQEQPKEEDETDTKEEKKKVKNRKKGKEHVACMVIMLTLVPFFLYWNSRYKKDKTF